MNGGGIKNIYHLSGVQQNPKVTIVSNNKFTNDHSNYRLAHVNEKFGNTVTTGATTVGTIVNTSSFASTSAVVNAVVGGGNNNTTTVITTEEEEEEDEHILKVVQMMLKY